MSAKTPEPKKYEMPQPPAVVIWRHAPGGEPNYALVTRHGKSAISVLIFPPDSRVGIPKDAVRYIDDPLNKNLSSSDAGIWEFTEESKLIQLLTAERAARNTEVKPTR